MNKRIVGYDLARALAVFGMVVVNFKIVMGAEENGPAWLVALVAPLSGRAAATFVVLAGAGLALLTRTGRVSGDRGRIARDRRSLLKRALFLFVVGLLYTPLWPADILHFYGVYIAVAAFLFTVRSSRLWMAIVAIALMFVALLFVLDYERGWDWATLDYHGLWTPAGMIRHLFFNGFHPVIPWLAFLLLGLILGRQDLSVPAVRRRVMAWGAGIAIVAEAASWLFIRTLSAGASPEDLEVIQALAGTGPMPPMPLYLLAGGGTACAVIALSIAVGERYADSRWLRPFISTGQLALTLYVAHVVLGMGALEALGRLEEQTLPVALGAAGVFCVAGVVFAHAWRRRYKRGPLEAVMRKLTQE